MDINISVISGRVGQDPQTRLGSAAGNNDFCIATFSIANNRYWKNKNSTKQDEWNKRTTWIKCVTMRPNLVSMITERVKKGTAVVVQGQWQGRKIEDQANPGQQKQITELLIDTLLIVDPGASRLMDDEHQSHQQEHGGGGDEIPIKDLFSPQDDSGF